MTKQMKVFLHPATIAAFQAEARYRGVTNSQLAEEMIVRALSQDVAARLEERALPAFTAAVQQVVGEQVRRQERRLVAALAPLARDAGMAARLTYSHLYRDHPAAAERDWQDASEQMDALLHAEGPASAPDMRRRGAHG